LNEWVDRSGIHGRMVKPRRETPILDLYIYIYIYTRIIYLRTTYYGI